MKKKIQIQLNNPVRYLFSEIGFTDKKALRLTTTLNQYYIHNVAQLIGAFCPAIPKLSEKNLKKHGITCTSKTLINRKKPV
ncbi:MAG TPA: hypothetical protein VKA38_08515, partial [Draconibacterium sp.]|nr:hypothetical protein [Draconibacterium sp.]